MLIVHSCASTQSLAIISGDTEKRTGLLRSPWLWSFVRSSASTDGKAVRANDTNIAGRADDVCLSTSLLGLVPLTDLSICTAWKVTELRSAHWTVATITTRRTSELAVYQGIRCTSLPILVSRTERRAGACWRIAEFPSTHGAMAALQTWRTTKLTGYQGIRRTSLLTLVILTGRSIGACGEIAEFPSTHGAMAALQTCWTSELTIDNLRVCSAFLVAAGEGSC